MNPFEITIDGRHLTVHPTQDTTFQIYEGETLISELHASSDGDGGYSWHNQSEEDGSDLDDIIGKAIEVYLPSIS
jgi:hypothetical protein